MYVLCFSLVCINVTFFVMYLWMGNELGEFWHFIEDTTEKKENGEGKKKHERALLRFLLSAAFISSF